MSVAELRPAAAPDAIPTAEELVARARALAPKLRERAGIGTEQGYKECLRLVEILHGVEHGIEIHGHGVLLCHISPRVWVNMNDTVALESVTRTTTIL